MPRNTSFTGPLCGIINPAGAGGSTGRRVARIEALFRRHFPRAAGEVRWRRTRSAGDAPDLVREALREGAGTIVSVGGDGTHNEVVQGFFDQRGSPINPEARLAILQCGTGGDLCRSLGVPRNIDKAVEMLSRARARTIDLALLDYADLDGRPARRYFINITSAGIGGLVDRFVAGSRCKWAGGTAVFAAATLRALLFYRTTPVAVSLDDGPFEEQLACGVVAANGRYFGGGMCVAPKALMDDGLLDVIVLGDFHASDFLVHAGKLYAGTHLKLDKVWTTKVRTVKLRSEGRIYLDVDGESPGCLPAQISVVPKALTAVAGETAAIR